MLSNEQLSAPASHSATFALILNDVETVESGSARGEAFAPTQFLAIIEAKPSSTNNILLVPIYFWTFRRYCSVHCCM